MRSCSRIINNLLVAAIIIFSSFPIFAQGVVLNADKRAAGEEVEGIAPEPTLTTADFQSAAKQAVLIDFNTDMVLYNKEAETRMFPSSMTKVLTMYLVFDQLRKGHIKLDTEFPVSEKSWKTGGSQMFLKIGDKVKVDDLIQGVIVQSGNDACVALAEGISGSVEAFVEDMNTVALQLGMKDTKFANPDGLPTEGHFTTAKDLTIIARRLITDFPEYYHYYSQREFTYGGIKQYNRNKLLDIADLGVDGMKTGYTEMGGYGMIATGSKNGRRLVAVVNGLESESARLQAAAELIRYGYNNFKEVKLFNKGDVIGKVKVWNGVEDKVSITAEKDVEFLVERRAYNFNNYKVQIAYSEPWVAPIKAGTNIANLVIKDKNEKIIHQIPLYANKDIKEAGIVKKIIQKAKYLVGKY